jgi:hypothetical protein
MSNPQTGAVYQYSGEHGLAQAARIADPSVPNELPAEMHELDLPPQTRVTVADIDEDRDLVIVEWVDRSGNQRRTSIDQNVFATDFTEV